MTTIRAICEYLKEIAPLNLAEDWDNVGLLLGNDSVSATRAVTCLTLTPDVANEAIGCGANLIVTHHPILFKAVKKITFGQSEGRMIQDLIQHGVAVYSPHTAWDNSATGINQQLAELLELTDIRPLRPRVTSSQVKIMTSLPHADLDAVRQALWKSGAGVIGDYQNCSFSFPGTGTFYGLEASHPVIGQAGRQEQVEEVRLEVICPAANLEASLAALRAAHPYEEPAIDVFSLTPIQDGTGAGRYGQLPVPMTMDSVCRRVAARLGLADLQFVGSPSRVVQRVGIACGAAGEYLRDSHRTGCDLFITGEARFHSCLEAIDLGIGLILPGHYATERFAMENLATRLMQRFTGLSVTASTRETNPVQTLVTEVANGAS